MTPDRSFRAYLRQSTFAGLGRSNLRLFPVNVLLVLGGIVGVGCTASAEPAIPAVVTPTFTTDQVTKFCALIEDNDGVLTTSEMAEAFANGYGPGGVDLFYRELSRCGR